VPQAPTPDLICLTVVGANRFRVIDPPPSEVSGICRFRRAGSGFPPEATDQAGETPLGNWMRRPEAQPALTRARADIPAALLEQVDSSQTAGVVASERIRRVPEPTCDRLVINLGQATQMPLAPASRSRLRARVLEGHWARRCGTSSPLETVLQVANHKGRAVLVSPSCPRRIKASLGDYPDRPLRPWRSRRPEMAARACRVRVPTSRDRRQPRLRRRVPSPRGEPRTPAPAPSLPMADPSARRGGFLPRVIGQKRQLQ
jgi:hypothetical protein